MNGSREVVTVSDNDESKADSKVDYVFAAGPSIKLMKPLYEPTRREARRHRDLIYLILKREGLSADEIEVACRDAARSASQIRRRINQATVRVTRELSACG